MKRVRFGKRVAFMALLLSSSFQNSSQYTTFPSQRFYKGNSNDNYSSTTQSSLRKKRNLKIVAEPLKSDTITMTLTGVNPLSPSDLNWFQDQTQAYINYYYNDADPTCSECLQNSIDIKKVSILVTDQDPPFDADSASMNNGSNEQVILTYSQTTTYIKEDNTTSKDEPVVFDDIVKEPFNNIIKRKEYRNDFLNTTGAPDAFLTLSLTSSPVILENNKSFFTSIGFYAIIAAVGFALIVALILLLYCRCGRRRDDKISDGERYRDGEVEQARNKNGQRQLQNGQLPSQLQLSGSKDEEVSTIMVDPQPQTGMFSSGGKSIGGFNAESVGEIDPMYSDMYGGGASDLSSAGGTYGAQTQQSKFSAMESILTPGMNGGQSTVYTSEEDHTLFEHHMRNRRQGGSSANEEYIDIYAPGGKLGVVIDTPNMGGPVVHNIKDTCPIADQLRVGDKLVAVDDEDVRSMTAVKVSKLISQKSNNPKRKFTILRKVED